MPGAGALVLGSGVGPALTADYRYGGDQPVCEVAEDGGILAGKQRLGTATLLSEARGEEGGWTQAVDPLGNVVQRLDADGEEISTDLYDAWGNSVGGSADTDPYPGAPLE